MRLGFIFQAALPKLDKPATSLKKRAAGAGRYLSNMRMQCNAILEHT